MINVVFWYINHWQEMQVLELVASLEKESSIKILQSSSYYTSAPMFFVTNTAANINLEDYTFKFGSGTFLKVSECDWGISDSNGEQLL